MVLGRGWLLTLIAIGSVFANSAQAQTRAKAIAGLYKFRVENSSCSLRIRDRSGWQVYRGAQLPLGTLVIGRPSERSPDLIVFKVKQLPRSVFAGRRSCLFQKASPEELNLGETYKYQATFAVMSWQESLTRKIKGQSNVTHLRATSLAVCPGFTMLRIREKYEYGGGLCAFYGKSQAGRSGPMNPEKQDTGDYVAKNVDVLGVALAPKAFWRPESGNVAFGVSLPILARYGNWPVEVDSNANIGPKLWFLVGLALEARLERGSYYFAQRVGFLNLPKSLNWAFEGGYTF